MNDEALKAYREEVGRITRQRDEAREVVASLMLGIELYVGFNAIESIDVNKLPTWATPWLDAKRAAASDAGHETT